jgi:pimeloyl-ACP methyl ester carboxylesterase
VLKALIRKETMLLIKLAQGLLATALVVAGFWVAANWAPDEPVSALAARWAKPPSSFVPLEGMSVHVRDEGRRDDPQPIVLIHGTASNLHTWDGWAAGLLPSRRVVRMDLPGFGLTGPAPDGTYTPQRYAHFVLDVMDHLGIKRAILVGNSLGGGVAWLAAVTAPDRVAKLVLIDAAGFPLQSRSVPIGFRLAAMPMVAPLFNHVLPRSVIESSLRSVYGDPARITPETVDLYYDMTRRAGNREALAQKTAQTNFAPLEHLISTIGQPTLILWGAADRLVDPANADRFHAAIPGSQVMVFPGLGHVPQEEAPKETLAAALPFLAK